jgi:ABC-type oligopeptide transport system substrate-binding subunit
MLVRADSTTAFDDSISVYQQAEDLLLSDVPGAPVCYAENLYLLKNYVRGPKDNLSSFDYAWAGEWGPLATFDIDLAHVPDNYPTN